MNDKMIFLATSGSELTSAAIDLEAAVAELAKLSPLEFDQVRKDQAAFLNVQVSTLTAEVKKARKRNKPKKVAPAAASQADIEKLELSAAAIIDCEDVLKLFEQVWCRVVAGEKTNARILYLVATSRLFTKPMHAAVKGPSSGGKSEIRRRVLDFMPPEDVVSFDTLTEKALIYYQGEFSHKVLSMGEAAGTEEQDLQDYLLRQLMSEGRLTHFSVQKIGNELITMAIEKEGPVAFMVTTTKHQLHAENETRMLSIEIDDLDIQTKLVLEKVAQIEGLGEAGATIDYECWRDFQRWLKAGNCEIVIPYAMTLARQIPPKAVRLRRDIGQVFRAIKAHALLHRNHRPTDSDGRIIANLEDYSAVAALMSDLVAETTGTKVRKTTMQTVSEVAVLTNSMPDDEGATAQQVARALRLDKSAARRRLISAMAEGFIVNLETRKGHPGRYRATDEIVDVEDVLPAVEALTSQSIPESTATLPPTRKT